MKLSTATLGLPLRFQGLRRRIRFELRQQYFAEEDLGVPLGHGCVAPILSPDYWHSFEEIFFMGEYARPGAEFPLPSRWLDLGCHAGFFSLYMELQRRQAHVEGPCEALLVDGDGRVGRQVNRVIDRNGLRGKLRFEHGAIARGTGSLTFVERVCMASGVDADGPSAEAGVKREVPIVTPERVLALCPPPYDLIKVDIEGGEHDFLTGYEDVFRHTDVLLLEWHSWHGGGGGLPQIKTLAAQLGFGRQQEYRSAHHIPAQGTAAECGLLLLKRQR